MKIKHFLSGAFSLNLFALTGMLVIGASSVMGQVVINEFVFDDSGADEREFVELYNAGGSAVDIGDWTLDHTQLDDGTFNSDAIPSGTMLAAGDYYVIGSPDVPNLDLDLEFVDLWFNNYSIFELRNSGSTLIDAVSYETNKGLLLGQTPLTAAQIAQTGTSGIWGNSRSNNTFPQSLSRYTDGLDTNVNGRDFGLIPLTPGTSNNLPFNTNYALPDLSGLAVDDDVPGLAGSFVIPKVADPTVASAENPTAISASPQGGNVIIAWDSTGGGNMAASNELVDSFLISAYLDTGLFGEAGDFVGEQTSYGIGSTGTFHNLGNPSGTFGSNSGGNGNTGIGWFYEKQDADAESGNPQLTNLHLIDFGAGGDSEPGGDWTIIETIDLSAEASDWHDLGIDVDDLGNVTATFDDQTFNFTTSTDLVGTFYVGYRETLGGVPTTLRPPTFDLISSGTADADGDGDIDGADFLKLQRENPAGIAAWSAAYPGALSAVNAVPEPGSAILLVGLSLGMLSRRQRRVR